MGNVTKELDLIRQIDQRDKRIDELELIIQAKTDAIELLIRGFDIWRNSKTLGPDKRSRELVEVLAVFKGVEASNL